MPYMHTYTHLHSETHLFQSKLEPKPATASLIKASIWQEEIYCYVVYLVCNQGSEVATGRWSVLGACSVQGAAVTVPAHNCAQTQLSASREDL